MNLLPGTILGQRYRIDALLGEGGMGAVYRATDWRGAGCALKVLRPECLASADLQRRFDQEARIGMHLRHPNIRQVWDCGVDPHTHLPYLAMELLLGEDLAARLAWRHYLRFEELGPLLSQLCDALAMAHATGIVHRDLKPENLFLTASPGGTEVLKVLDFGIAKVLAGQSHANSVVIGTPAWMAPEQLGVDADIGPATDVWAVGLLAFFVLTGRSYWPTANDSAASFGPLIVDILDPSRRVPASVRAQQYGCPERIPPGGFDAWFAACTAISPRDRHRDVPACWAALWNVLTSVLANAPTAPVTPFARTAPALFEEDPMVEQVIAELRRRMPAALAAATPDAAVVQSRPSTPDSAPRTSDPGRNSAPRTSDPGCNSAPAGAYAPGSLPGTPASPDPPRTRIPLVKRVTPTPPPAAPAYPQSPATLPAHSQSPFAPPAHPQSPFAPPAVAQSPVHAPRAPPHAARAQRPQTWLVPAGKGLRFAAMMVDRFLSLLAGIAVGVVCEQAEKRTFLLALLLTSLVTYFLRDLVGGGRSPGKHFFNLEIIDVNTGAPIGMGAAFGRQILSLDGIPIVNLVIGTLIDGILVLARDDGRRTGDLVSSTQVVQRVRR